MSNESDLKKLSIQIEGEAYLILKDEQIGSARRSELYGNLIQFHRNEARLLQCEYALKVILSKLRSCRINPDSNGSVEAAIARDIEKYPQAWGLAGNMLPANVLGIDPSPIPEKEDKDIPHVQVGKAGGSRAAGVPAVVDQDSAEIRARSTRTMP